MSLFKEITESHDTVKAIAVILFLIPFWYVAIFLFNNEFYKSSDNLIILAMCIVISMISAVLLSFFVQNNEAKYQNNTILEHMGVSVTILIIWLSILIFSFYSLGFLLNIHIYFYWFLVIYFAPLILFNFLQIVFGKRINKS
jgi:hypothetical protein